VREFNTFMVIGLGEFGKSVAFELVRLGKTVYAIDKNPDIVDIMGGEVAQVFGADATEYQTLQNLGISDVDVAIVCVGDMEENLKISYNLTVRLKLSYVIAKAKNEIHEGILKKIGVKEVIFPEQEIGTRIARRIVSPNVVDVFQFGPNVSTVEIIVPEDWVGHTIKELRIRNKYGVNVLAIRRGDKDIIATPEELFSEGDVVIIFGYRESLAKLVREVS